MIIATDLDRTLLPNGPAKDSKTLSDFFRATKKLKAQLIYASGRNLNLLEDAIEQYKIELPDFFIAEVGTVLYQKQNGKLVPHSGWNEFTARSNPNWNRDKITAGSKLKKYQLQEDWKQNKYKVSYYINKQEKQKALNATKNIASNLKINAEIIWSIDPLLNTGLLDILPATATKLSTLEFVRKDCLGEKKEEVIYSGDSGNDILPLTFGYKSILVNNAPRAVKEKVLQIAKEKDLLNETYIASGKKGKNGNYSSGILEGLEYFGYI